MPIDDNYQSNSSAPAYRWKCTHEGCRREIVSWSEVGLVRLRDMHTEDHEAEDKVIREEREKRFKVLSTHRTYNYLELSWADINFLKTRGIAIDENVNYNKYMKHDPCYDTERKDWRQVLERAWPLENK